MSDIAEELIAAIGRAEDTVPPLRMGAHYVGPRTDTERALLARCAADREIIAMYLGTKRLRDDIWQKIRDGQQLTGDDVREAGEADRELAALGAVLEILTHGYGIQP